MHGKQNHYPQVLVSYFRLSVLSFLFRVVNCLVRLMHYYMIGWLDMLDIGELTISSLYFVLAIWNFRASEWIYDNVVSEAF